MFHRDRVWSGLVTFAVLGSVLWPLTWALDRDSFPLSNYPMFAWPRLTAACAIAQAYGVDASGRRMRLPPTALGRTPGVTAALDVNRQLELLLLGPSEAIEPYCRKIAAYVAEDPALRWVRRIEIARDEYDSLVFHSGSKEPARTVSYAACLVQR
jgi:hypothetical protein